MLSFVYEDGIKIKNKYFATIYELRISQIKPSVSLPHETIPLINVLYGWDPKYRIDGLKCLILIA
jgi:hypothetical protein